MEIVRTAERFRKLVGRPNFKSFTLFGEDLVAVESTPSVIRLDNLPASGLTILDTSKVTMLRLYWRLKGQFGSRMKVLFTDTDSFGVEITSNSIHEELSAIKDILDTSGLPRDHPLYDPSRSRQPGYLKIEYGHTDILAFAGIRPKCYCLDLGPTETVVMKCKGIQSAALYRSVSFEDYKNCIFKNVLKEVTCCSLRTDGKHHVYTMQQRKWALRNFDQKRYILPDGIHTRAFGYEVRNIILDRATLSIFY